MKTQLQSQSAQNIAVGHQHNHLNSWSAFKALWMEGGIAALYRGWHANIPRLFVGSATQLTAFGMVADWLRSLQVSISINIAASESSIETYVLAFSQVFPNQPILLTFMASLIGGSCVALTWKYRDRCGRKRFVVQWPPRRYRQDIPNRRTDRFV